MRITRRRLLSCFGAVVGAAALSALGQYQPKRIGVLTFRGGVLSRAMPDGLAFLQAMKDLGYREGRDYVVDERLWEQQAEAPGLVEELVRLKADVIVAAGPPSILAAKRGTEQIPIVMMYSAEPVAMGIVASLARPGGNITGLTYDHGFATMAKAIELMRETVPGLRRVAILWDGTDSVHPVYERYFAKAAAQSGLTPISVELKQVADLDPAFARMRKERAEALILLPSGQLTIPNRQAIMRLATKHRIPTVVNIVDNRDYPGAVLRYGPNFSSMPRRAAAYVDRILKGARPADIPVEQPDKYDLVVDLTAARQLGIKVPPSVLVRADRVIQ